MPVQGLQKTEQLGKQSNLEKKTLKWASSRRKAGTFSEQCWGDLEQGTEPPKVEMPVQGSFLTLDTSPSVITHTCAHFMSM